VVPFVLVSERNNEIAFAGKGALAETRCDLGFDPIHDLLVERGIVIRKSNLLLFEQTRLCNQRQKKK